MKAITASLGNYLGGEMVFVFFCIDCVENGCTSRCFCVDRKNQN